MLVLKKYWNNYEGKQMKCFVDTDYCEVFMNAYVVTCRNLQKEGSMTD